MPGLSYEEFEAFFDNWDRERAEGKARLEKFIQAMEDGLIAVCFNYFPEMEPYKDHFIEALARDAREQALDLYEFLDPLIDGFRQDAEVINPNFKTPDRDQTEKEKQYLEDILKTMPPEQHAFFIELNEERVKFEAEAREFQFQCFDKTKEIIRKHFPELQDFSSNALRNVNFIAWVHMSLFKESYYFLTGELFEEEPEE